MVTDFVKMKFFDLLFRKSCPTKAQLEHAADDDDDDV